MINRKCIQVRWDSYQVGDFTQGYGFTVRSHCLSLRGEGRNASCRKDPSLRTSIVTGTMNVRFSQIFSSETLDFGGGVKHALAAVLLFVDMIQVYGEYLLGSTWLWAPPHGP